MIERNPWFTQQLSRNINSLIIGITNTNISLKWLENKHRYKIWKYFYNGNINFHLSFYRKVPLTEINIINE